MPVVAWIGIGWLGVIFWTAVGARFHLGHVVPDAAVITLTFVSLRRSPAFIAIIAVALGYLVGRESLAPVGLTELVFLLTSLAVYFIAGSIAGSGRAFFALSAGAAVGFAQVVTYLIASIHGGAAGFPSWVTAALVPTGAATAAVAFMLHGVLTSIERKLSPDDRQELSWR